MKTKIVIVSVFALIIIGLCVIELGVFSGTIADISTSSKDIISQIESGEEKSETLNNLRETYAEWKEKEGHLCLIYNHKDLLEIGKELNQAISYVEIDNNEEAYVHMRLLEEDLRALENIVNFDVWNIF